MKSQPAFPILDLSKCQLTGMSLLTYIATKAMQGILSNSNYPSGKNWQEEVALDAYDMAEAMLKEEAKKGDTREMSAQNTESAGLRESEETESKPKGKFVWLAPTGKPEVKILSTSHHRNGISGVPFDVTLFECSDGKFIAFDFADNGGFGVVDINKAHDGDIGFGSNSWRGDYYQDAVREAASKVKDSVNDGFYIRYIPKKRL